MKPTEFEGITLSRYASDVGGELSFEQLLILLNGEDGGGRPDYCSPVLVRFGSGLSYRMPDDVRQQLLTHVLPLLRSHDISNEGARRDHIALATLKRIVPLALRQEGLAEEAGILENFEGSIAEASRKARELTGSAVSASAKWAAANAAEKMSPSRAAEEAMRAVTLTAQIDPSAWSVALEIFEEAIELGAHHNGDLTEDHQQRLNLLQAA